MLAFLPSPILFLINIFFIPLNSVAIALPIQILGIIRFCLPFEFVIVVVEKCNYYLYKLWVFNNAVIIRITNDIKWNITGDKIPTIDKSCIVISNHLSWLDIIIIACIYRGKIPTTKFFMKHSLIYIPFVGLACYALGMPFLRRYTREQLIKDPSLRTKDIDSTKKACKRLVYTPSSLINFVEGTRFTKEKAKLAKSAYENLMPPKAASLAIALGEIGKDIDYVFNTTLIYPENTHKPFIDLLFGRMKSVYADVQLIKTGPEIEGDYLQDKVFKHSFTMYVRDLWQKKDALISSLLKSHSEKK